MPPFPFDYLTLEPTGRLADYVEGIWYARGRVPYEREQIAPAGATVAIFVLGPPIHQTPWEGEEVVLREGGLLGPHDRPLWNAPSGETHAYGVVARPWACRSLFGVAPAAIRGAVQPFSAVWPRGLELRAALAQASDPENALQGLAAGLARGVEHTRGEERCRRAVEALEQDPARSIEDIATDLGISHSHLDREFSRVVGLGPRRLSRLLKVRRLLQQLDVSQPVRWAELAHAGGWADQAHLSRDFKHHTGVSPTAYVRIQREVYAPTEAGEGAGFVPAS